MSKYTDVKREIDNNNPPIIFGGIWYCVNDELKVLRRIRILTRYPSFGMHYKNHNHHGHLLICEELEGGSMRSRIGEINLCPEFNLRYVFRPEPESR